MASPFLQGFQVGAGVASDRANRALRMQQLQSERQMRMLQERNLAEQLALRMEERNLAIQERADMTKAITAAQEATQPFHIVQGEDGEMGVPNPNPMTQEQAAMAFVLPVVGKYQPDKVPQFLQGVALAEYRRNAAQVSPAEQALVDQRKAATTLTEEKIKQIREGTGGTDSEFIKTIKEVERRTGKVTPPDKLQQMLDVKMGLLPKTGTVTIPSEAAYVAENLKGVMEDNRAIEETITTKNIFGRESSETKRRRPSNRQEAMEYLRKEYRDIYGRAEAPAPAAATPEPEAQPTEAVAAPSTQPEMLPATQLKVGDVVKGYQFNGKFPPGDRRAWDKVQ